jgi:pimeloyl-ACP methyl ester carboxylesterase
MRHRAAAVPVAARSLALQLLEGQLPERVGHFAAWEEPELFATEIRAAFKSLRS